jgi:hypothetical protein
MQCGPSKENAIMLMTLLIVFFVRLVDDNLKYEICYSHLNFPFQTKKSSQYSWMVLSKANHW